MAPSTSIRDLDTPALVCDLDVLERNIHDMAERCQRLDIALRAHVKSHKIPAIAAMQRDAGARGICCQKLGEAEVMMAAGFEDVLIPFNIVSHAKLQRLARLAGCASLTVCADSEATVQGLATAVSVAGVRLRVLVELDTGFGRCGVQTPAAAVALAITTVVSTPTDARAIIDAGVKAFASYPPLPFGVCVEDPLIVLGGMSFEHGILDVSEARTRPRIGDRLSFIPTQQEVTVNLHDRMYAVRGERVEHTWAIEARGCFS